jgi:hypothetical protein
MCLCTYVCMCAFVCVMYVSICMYVCMCVHGGDVGRARYVGTGHTQDGDVTNPCHWCRATKAQILGLHSHEVIKHSRGPDERRLYDARLVIADACRHSWCPVVCQCG